MRIADAAEVGTLAIFHHDPSHGDAFMDDIAREAAAQRPGTAPGGLPRVIVAHEGLMLAREPDAQSAGTMAASGARPADGAEPGRRALVHPAPLRALAAAARRAAALFVYRGTVHAHAEGFRRLIDLVDTHATAARGACMGCSSRRGFPRSTPPSPYALVRERKPQRIIEVGSGHSTRVLAKALGGMGEILAIDPAPRADIAGLPGVRSLPSTVQATPPSCSTG